VTPSVDHHDPLILAASAVDAFLLGFVARAVEPAILTEAVRYALLGGGKRLRPALAWASAEAVGADAVRSVPAGAAVELVHAFSLVHDDLPAMDDDDLRRGKPTVHKAFDEATAILAGDALQTHAFGVLDEPAPGHARPDAAVRVRLVAELVRGTTGMIAGQVYDTLGGFAGALGERERLELVHRNKTGALIAAACRMGAIAGGAGERELAAVSAFADAVGLQFQAVDDLIDVEQPAEVAGKRTGKDAQAGKLTYPGLLGVEATRRIVAELGERARAALEPLGPAADGLRGLAARMEARTA
jgi:geranylgeranyl pyrophosphate synthase